MTFWDFASIVLVLWWLHKFFLPWFRDYTLRLSEKDQSHDR